MTKEQVYASIMYLDGFIENYDTVKEFLDKSTNQKDKNKHNEKLYEIMFDAKKYIIENDLFKFAVSDNKNREKIFLEELTKVSYFKKDLKGFISNLENKIL